MAAVWDPPYRFMRDTWRRFKDRSAPLRALGFVLCALIALASVVILAALLALVLIGPVLLVAELL